MQIGLTTLYSSGFLCHSTSIVPTDAESAIAWVKLWAREVDTSSVGRVFYLVLDGEPYYGQSIQGSSLHCQICRRPSLVVDSRIPFEETLSEWRAFLLSPSNKGRAIIQCPECYSQ